MSHSESEQPPVYVSVAEAREMLGVSEPHMARLLKEGVLVWERNPVDRRGKIIKLADVESLVAKLPRSKEAA